MDATERNKLEALGWLPPKGVGVIGKLMDAAMERGESIDPEDILDVIGDDPAYEAISGWVVS